MRRDRHDTRGLFESDDVLSVVLEAALWITWGLLRAAFSIMVGMLRFPALTLAAAVALLGWATLGARGVTVVLGVLVISLVAWRVAHPLSYRRHAGVALTSATRSVYYRSRWRGIAYRTDLVVYDRYDRGGRRARSGARAASLVKVRVSASRTDRLLLSLPTGMVPADVAEKVEAIAHAVGCTRARVRPDRPGRCWLELSRHDGLDSVVTPLPIPTPLDLSRVPIGLTEEGAPWCLKLAGTHLLVAGATGSGKSSVLWSLLRGVSGGIAEGLVEVWAVDPKGGMELRPGRALFTRFEDSSPEDMCRLLEDLVVLKDERSRRLANEGSRAHTPALGAPHVIALLDELATLTAFADRAVTRRIDNALGLLLTQGRACGITVVAAVQDPGKDIVGWRDLFPTRIAMRLDNPMQIAMVLGDGARDDGARADEISELTPGVAYVRVDGTRQVLRARAAYLDDDAITELAQTVSAGSHSAGFGTHLGRDDAAPFTTADLPPALRATPEGEDR